MRKNIFLFASLMLLFLLSCKEDNKVKEKELSEKVVVQDIKKVEVDIEGMTCEIGCAKLIESKLSKANGVQFASISFDEKKGEIEFDANVIDEKQIKGVIEAAGGGDLYTVVSSRIVEKF
ncbi:MAG: heavy-metal-associated domain-containing protein [Lutimonas sp.]